ncbi:hypothetical protein CPB84DRAFT_325793 [Gymnopilus junonius]|uniref:BTB domain-containing protein n=1 Tax=Gymnopilus junonius TaxID=109634 RepID=A0A9P5NDL3_GYMJU|nr:hypothetical protein CPB84DRAFT_325793 [Gymnopilus junonius]
MNQSSSLLHTDSSSCLQTVSLNMPDEALSTPIVNDQFSAQDADITIQSSDGILFKLHRSNLAGITGAFPGPEIDTQGEIVHLTEPAKVLEIVFQYVYPRKHPSLKDLDFDTLLQVAEAVEKYDVFSAMNTCEWRLSEFLPDHAVEILAHSVKHGYPESIDKAGLVLSRTPHLEMVEMLPLHCVVPWLKYQGAWQKIFDNAIRHIDGMFYNYYCYDVQHVCSPCRVSLLGWVTKLSQIKTISSLRDAITTRNPSIYNNSVAHPWCSNCSGNICQFHLPTVQKILEDGITSIPPFTEFLKAKEPAPSA